MIGLSNIRYVFFCSSVGIFFTGYYFRTSISPIADVLEHDLNTTATGVGLLASMYYLAYSGFQIPWSLLIQYSSPIKISLFGGILFTVLLMFFSYIDTVSNGSLISFGCGFATSPCWLCVLQIVDNRFELREVPFLIGLQMLVTYSLVFGLNIAQAEIYEQYEIWREAYWALAALCLLSVLALICVWIFDKYIKRGNMITDMNASNGNIDGNANENSETHSVFAIKIKMHQMVKNENISEKKTEISIIKPLLKIGNDENSYHQNLSLSRTTDTDIAVGYKYTSSPAETPTISIANNSLMDKIKHTFGNKLNWVLSLWGFCGLVTVNSLNGLWLISYMMVKFKYSRSLSAFISGLFFISRAVSAVIIGRLAMHFGKRKIFVIFGSLMMFGSVFIIYCPPSTAMWIIILANMISGSGSCVYSITWTLCREYNQQFKCKSIAGGMMNTLQNSGSFVSQLLISELIDAHWMSRGADDFKDGDRNYVDSDFESGFIIIPISVCIQLLAAFLLKETNGKNLVYDVPSKETIKIDK